MTGTARIARHAIGIELLGESPRRRDQDIPLNVNGGHDARLGDFFTADHLVGDSVIAGAEYGHG